MKKLTRDTVFYAFSPEFLLGMRPAHDPSSPVAGASEGDIHPLFRT